MDIKVIGIDLAKNVFQVYFCLMDNSIMSNKKVNRNKLLDKIRPLPEGSLIVRFHTPATLRSHHPNP